MLLYLGCCDRSKFNLAHGNFQRLLYLVLRGLKRGNFNEIITLCHWHGIVYFIINLIMKYHNPLFSVIRFWCPIEVDLVLLCEAVS